MGNRVSREEPEGLVHGEEVQNLLGINPEEGQDEDDEDVEDRSRPTRKRKGIRDDEKDEDASLDILLHTPKKMKLKTTSQYIYETLFLQSQDHDITVEAFGSKWKLHKLYLCQSKYFSCMFSGNWMESNLKKIKIDIPDSAITKSAFNTALGSLYQDELTIEPAEVVPLLATACLLQLEGLSLQCQQTMIETLNINTVIEYWEASDSYGTSAVEKKCLEWFYVNLLSHIPEQPKHLRKIPASLLSRLIESHELFVMQTEFSIYVLLRLWLFLNLKPSWTGTPSKAVATSHHYFKSRARKSKRYFLDTPEGLKHVDLFKKLRLNFLINHHMDSDMLNQDQIIPKEWMYPVYENQWKTMLLIDQGVDRGPTVLSEEDFNKLCLRCGRTLQPGALQHMWRWTGFNMGLDLIITFDEFSLSIRRNQKFSQSIEHEALLSTHKKRNIWFKVTATCLNDQKQVSHSETSGLRSICLSKNGNQIVMKLSPTKFKFPLYLSFNFVTSSQLQGPKKLPDDEDKFTADDDTDI